MFVETVAVLFLALLIWLYISDGTDPLDKLPSLPKLPIIGNAHQTMRVPSDELLDYVVGHTKLYGDRYIYKLMRYRLLQLTRPSDIQVVLFHSKNISKSLPYEFVRDWLGSGLLTNTGEDWHKRRKILTPAFHFNILKNFASIMEEKSGDLINLLRDKKGVDLDVMPIISDYTLFVICETAMGTKLDKDKSTAAVEYKKTIEKIGLVVINRLPKIWLWSNFIFKNTSEGKEFFKWIEILHSFAEFVIKERKARRIEGDIVKLTANQDLGTKRKLAMLDLLLDAKAKGEIDIAGIKDEVNTFMFEGHDTTANAIAFGLMLLADHEEIQDRIFWEIQDILNNTDRFPSLSDLVDMKYMEAAIKETLRLYPSVPFIGRMIEEDFMLDDVLVKRGNQIGIHIYALHRREDIFPEAESFKPERFLHGSELKNPFSYVPFSAGPRNCIGQRFALQEMKITFCEIIRNFKLVPKMKGARPRLVTDMLLRPAEPIYIKFIPRK